MVVGMNIVYLVQSVDHFCHILVTVEMENCIANQITIGKNISKMV